MQGIPFKDPEHRIPKHLRYLIERHLSEGKTLKVVSREFEIHHGIVKDIDILWCEEGKKKEQVYNFMGEDWMSHVKAVCMDMNAQYDSAFREKCPKIAVISDKFHIIRLYNDKILTSMHRRKQKELKDAGDEDGYELYKGSRFIVLSDRRILEEKDRRARENNDGLNRLAIMGIRWKPGSRKMHAGNEKRLDELLAVNDELSKAYFLLAQLKHAFLETDPKGRRAGSGWPMRAVLRKSKALRRPSGSA